MCNLHAPRVLGDGPSRVKQCSPVSSKRAETKAQCEGPERKVAIRMVAIEGSVASERRTRTTARAGAEGSSGRRSVELELKLGVVALARSGAAL